MPRPVVALLLAASLSLVVPDVHAQAPTFRAAVDLVPVDVQVLDPSGRPVHGLKAADFVVKDNGKAQTIQAFVEATHPGEGDDADGYLPGVASDVVSNQTAQSDRLVAIVVDDLHIAKTRSDNTRDVVERLIRGMGPNVSTAVLFTYGQHGTQMTEDRGALLAAAATVQGRRAMPRPDEARSVGDIGFFEDTAELRTIEDAARMLGANESRRRSIVLVSEGFGGPITRTPRAAADVSGGSQMMDALLRADVALYVIDPRGADDSAGGVWQQSQHALASTAQATGAFAITNTSDFAAGIARVLTALDDYYVLAFPPPIDGHGFHALEVKVDRPGLTVRFRRGYQTGPLPRPVNADPLAALSEDVMPVTRLPMHIVAIGVPGDETHRRIVASLDVVVSAPTDPADVTDRVTYELLAVSERTGKVEGQIRRTVDVTPSSLDASPLTYRLEDAVPAPVAGRYQLRASATSAHATVGGSVYTTVDVGDTAAAPIVFGGIALGCSQVATAPVVGPFIANAAAAVVPIVPCLDRTFAPDDVPMVFVAVSARPPAATPVLATIQILDAFDRVLFAVDSSQNAHGAIRAPLHLTNVPPGLYKLRVVATDLGGCAVREIPIRVKGR